MIKCPKKWQIRERQQYQLGLDWALVLTDKHLEQVQDTVVLWSNSSYITLEGWGFKSHRRQKYFSIQIDKNLFAEVRAAEKGNTLTLIWWRHLTVFV